jgi:hypothetical protein
MIAALLLGLAAAPSLSTDDLAVQALYNFGACGVEQTPQGARELLELDYRSPAYAKKMHAISRGHDRCATASRLEYNGMLFAGALAEALLKTDVKPGELATRIAYDPARPSLLARSATEDMALCTALQAPKETVALLATQPATHEEMEAMTPLGPVLGGCLRKGATVELNKPAIRALLALAAYRIATMPKAPAQ